MNTQARLIAQVTRRLRSLVINQARFQIPGMTDELWFVADEMTEAETHRWLRGRAILSSTNLIARAAKMDVADLFSGDDHWMDAVLEHIDEHSDDCKQLWDYVRSVAK